MHIHISLSFQDTKSDSDLEGLNLTNHVLAQLCVVSKSAFSIPAALFGLLTIIYKLVSSAKKSNTWMHIKNNIINIYPSPKV